MAEIPKLEWKWREHRDGDIGKARFKCFDLTLRDCDGDYCEWDIRRGGIYVAMGQERDIDPAEAKAFEVLKALYRAVEMNDFVANELPKLKAQGAGLMSIKRRETMRAEMKPDVYGGPGCDQVVPRWWTYADGDKEGGFEHEPLTLDARLHPPGTRISVMEPVCPNCDETREPIIPPPATGPCFKSKCRCGFDWDEWTGEEYS